jgi:putative phage-type endonuclease
MALALEQFASRAEWLAARKSGLGGSDAPIALGMSRWKSPMQLWSEKTGVLPPENDSVPEPMARRLGTLLEPAVAQLLAEESGVTIQRVTNAVVRDQDRPYLLCSPDGFVREVGNFDPVALVELKTADTSKADEWEEGVPPAYLVQVQHNLGVTGFKSAFVGCLIGTRDFKWMKVERDEPMIEDLRDRLHSFWDLVKMETPPDPTGAEGDTKALAALYRIPSAGKAVTLSADFLDLSWELDRLKDETKKAEERMEQIKNLIKAEMGDAEEGVLPGNEGSWTWKTQRRKEYVVAAAEFRVLRRKGGK